MFRPSVIFYAGGIMRNAGKNLQNSAKKKNKHNSGGRSRLTAVATSSLTPNATTTTTTTTTTTRNSNDTGGRKKIDKTVRGEFLPRVDTAKNANIISTNGRAMVGVGCAASAGGRVGKRSEEEIMQLAQRMQQRDLTGEVPVASFAYEVLKLHPSVRQMGLRERMAFLCDRWERLSARQRQSYLDNPLKGLL